MVVGEGAVFAEFVVRLSAPSSNTVSVSYEHQQRHGPHRRLRYESAQTALVFAPGETLKTVPIGIREDSSVEA